MLGRYMMFYMTYPKDVFSYYIIIIIIIIINNNNNIIIVIVFSI